MSVYLPGSSSAFGFHACDKCVTHLPTHSICLLYRMLKRSVLVFWIKCTRNWDFLKTSTLRPARSCISSLWRIIMHLVYKRQSRISDIRSCCLCSSVNIILPVEPHEDWKTIYCPALSVSKSTHSSASLWKPKVSPFFIMHVHTHTHTQSRVFCYSV